MSAWYRGSGIMLRKSGDRSREHKYTENSLAAFYGNDPRVRHLS